MPSSIVAPLQARLSTFHSLTRASVSANAIELRWHAVSSGAASARGGPPSPAAVESPSTTACTSGCVGPVAAGIGRNSSRPTISFTLPTPRRMSGAVNAVTMIAVRFTAWTNTSPPSTITRVRFQPAPRHPAMAPSTTTAPSVTNAISHAK